MQSVASADLGLDDGTLSGGVYFSAPWPHSGWSFFGPQGSSRSILRAVFLAQNVWVPAKKLANRHWVDQLAWSANAEGRRKKGRR